MPQGGGENMHDRFLSFASPVFPEPSVGECSSTPELMALKWQTLSRQLDVLCGRWKRPNTFKRADAVW